MKTKPNLSILCITNMYPDEDSPYYGIFVKEQCDELIERGHEVTLVDISNAGSGKSKYLSGRSLVEQALKERSYDVAHIHYGLTALACRGLDLPPTVVTFHGADINYNTQRPFSLWATRTAKQFVCVSPDLADQLSESRQQKTKVLPCGIPDRKFNNLDRKTARKKLGLDVDKPCILFPGAVDNTRKNYPLFSEAIDKLERSDIQVLKFGKVKPEDTPLYFAAADVTILTSFSEGSPQVVKESIFAGTPVISVDVGDVADYLPSIEGCSVTGYDAEEIANQIASLLADPKVPNPEQIRKIYGLSSVTDKLEKIFNQAQLAA